MRLFVRCGCKFSEAQKQDQCCILAQKFSLCGNLLARFFGELSFRTRIHHAVKYQARNCRKECAECAEAPRDFCDFVARATRARKKSALVSPNRLPDCSSLHQRRQGTPHRSRSPATKFVIAITASRRRQEENSRIPQKVPCSTSIDGYPHA